MFLIPNDSLISATVHSVREIKLFKKNIKLKIN